MCVDATPVVHTACVWFRGGGLSVLGRIVLKSLRGIFDRVLKMWVEMVGGVGSYRERWSASCDEDTGMVEMVGDVSYCVGCDMNVCDVLQEDEPDLGDEWRTWHVDDPVFERDDETESGCMEK